MNPEIIEISEIDPMAPQEIPVNSTNFGSGIELLMNEKQKHKKEYHDDVGIDDLEQLENELNNLSEVNSINDPLMNNSYFNEKKIDLQEENLNVHFEEPSNLGKTTANLENDQKTWDGYSKFNEIPINVEHNIPSTPSMSKEELLREKLKYLRRLESLEKKGVELTKKYNMDDSLLEMQGEYEMIMDEKSKQNSVKFQGNMLMACINGIEFLNNRFDPFDIKLDGWGEQVNENINDYDEIFSELHDKYKSKASLAPELKLLFQLGGSAMMVHMTNTLFKSSMPGMDDILRQNPELMKSFQTAAVNTMGQNNPGFSGFMSNMMNPNAQGPPPSMNTQGPNAIPTPLTRPGNNEFNQQFNRMDSNNAPQRSTRPEMNGPTDIDGILSGLKTKTINIQDSPIASNPQTAESSTISINDLKDLETNGKIPMKSKRRSKQNSRSSKNTISLDL